MSKSSDRMDLIGRVLLSLIFILAGINKAFSWDQTGSYLASRGLPSTHVLLTIAVLIEILGGLGILFGRFTRASAFVLFLYLIPVTLTFHAFWLLNGLAAQDQMAHFLKNLAIMGACLFITAHGPGRYSIDSLIWRSRGRGREPLKIRKTVSEAA